MLGHGSRSRGNAGACGSIAASRRYRMQCQRPCCLGILLAATGLAAAQQQDFSKVEIRTTTLTDGLYVLQGSGGNMTASVGAEGVLLVDDEFAEIAEKIRTALHGLGSNNSSGSTPGRSAAADRPL